jgi:hypothetical protein
MRSGLQLWWNRFAPQKDIGQFYIEHSAFVLHGVSSVDAKVHQDLVHLSRIAQDSHFANYIRVYLNC